MAELQFFATGADHESIVAELVSQFRAKFVVDAKSSESLQELTKVSEVMRLINSTKFGERLFVVSPLWQSEPLQASETKRQDSASLWHIRGRYGGPSLDYIAKHETTGDHGSQIIPSSIGTYATYYLNSGERPRPAGMNAAFAAVRRIVDRKGKRTIVNETGKPGPCAMSGALASFNGGSWLRVGEWHHVPAEA